MEETKAKLDTNAADIPSDLEAYSVALTESWERIRERVQQGNQLRIELDGLLTDAGKPVGMLFREGPPPVEVLPSDVEEVRELEDITDDLSTDLEKFQQVRAL